MHVRLYYNRPQNQLFPMFSFSSLKTFEFEKKEVYKYLKISFTSHYGNEFYCPVTVAKIYGYTLVEDLREQVELSQAKLQTFWTIS